MLVVFGVPPVQPELVADVVAKLVFDRVDVRPHYEDAGVFAGAEVGWQSAREIRLGLEVAEVPLERPGHRLVDRPVRRVCVAVIEQHGDILVQA